MFMNTQRECDIAKPPLVYFPVCPCCLQEGRRRPSADRRFVRYFRCISCGTTWDLRATESLNSEAPTVEERAAVPGLSTQEAFPS